MLYQQLSEMQTLLLWTHMNLTVVEQVLNVLPPPSFPLPSALSVGRTARAGRGGLALTLVGERDVALLQAVEERINVRMKAFDGLEEEAILKTMNKINTARRTGTYCKSASRSVSLVGSAFAFPAFTLALHALPSFKLGRYCYMTHCDGACFLNGTTLDTRHSRAKKSTR